MTGTPETRLFYIQNFKNVDVYHDVQIIHTVVEI